VPAGYAPAVLRDEDAEPTSPLPVILPGATGLPGATALPRPSPVEAPRGFFEAAQPVPEPPAPPAGTAGFAGSGYPAASESAAAGERVRAVSEAANAKLEQIKDLYLTAEAIGEEALEKHFEQVSQRQRELIREFFDRSGPGADPAS